MTSRNLLNVNRTRRERKLDSFDLAVVAVLLLSNTIAAWLIWSCISQG